MLYSQCWFWCYCRNGATADWSLSYTYYQLQVIKELPELRQKGICTFQQVRTHECIVMMEYFHEHPLFCYTREFSIIPRISPQDQHAKHPALCHQALHNPRLWERKLFLQGRRRFFQAEVFLQEEFQGSPPHGSSGRREGRAALQGQDFVYLYGLSRVQQMTFWFW